MNTPASAFRERRVTTGDGLSLYVRDYGDPASTATPVLCLSGLTRNSRDFHAFATRLAPQRRVLAMDYRGRGQSDYDPVVTNYRPDVYANDAIKVAADSGIERVVLVGTSLGGIVAMVLAALKPGFMTGAVLNDIGPEIPAEAAARMIRSGDFKYIDTHGHPAQLYDLRADPLELHNLAGRGANAAIEARLRDALLAGWDADTVMASVMASQRRRLYLKDAAGQTAPRPSWDYQATRDDSRRFVRASGAAGAKALARFPFVPPPK